MKLSQAAKDSLSSEDMPHTENQLLVLVAFL